MPVERHATAIDVLDVLDRVLDRGVVIDGWARVSLAGLELIGVETRIIVASIGTYLQRVGAVAQVPLAAKPRAAKPRMAKPVGPAAPLPRAPSQFSVAPIEAASPKDCPRCRKKKRRSELVMVTTQTGSETRITARCSACRWQRTYYGA
jgi:hypothetical protein